MPSLKISEFTTASTITGAEYVPIVQGGVNKKVTVTDILNDKNIVTQNPTTLALEVDGTEIHGVAAKTWAQFILLDPNDYHGIYVRISDKHAPHCSFGGSLVVGDSTAAGGWSPVQTPTFTRATVPSAATFSGWRIFVSDIGDRGSYWYSNGTRWLLDQPFVVLSNIIADIALSGAPTSHTVAKQVTIPLIDGKSIWSDGDILEVNQVLEKTGTTDIPHCAIYIGQTSRVLNDTETNTLICNASTVATNIAFGYEHKLVRRSATSIKQMAASGTASPAGGSATKAAVVTIPSLDTATSYVDACARFASAGGDSALTFTNHYVRLVSAGAA